MTEKVMPFFICYVVIYRFSKVSRPVHHNRNRRQRCRFTAEDPVSQPDCNCSVLLQLLRLFRIEAALAAHDQAMERQSCRSASSNRTPPPSYSKSHGLPAASPHRPVPKVSMGATSGMMPRPACFAAEAAIFCSPRQLLLKLLPAWDGRCNGVSARERFV